MWLPVVIGSGGVVLPESTTPVGRPPRRFRALYAVVVVVALFAVVRLIGLAGNCVSGRCRTLSGTLDASINAAGKTDPRLVGYSEGKSLQTGLQECRGIAVDRSGRIYVAGDYAIRVCLGDGTHKLDIRTDAKPFCLAVGLDGTIYAGMQDHVEVFDPGGRRTAVWGSQNKRACFTSIAVESGRIWVADAGNRAVLRYGRSGRLAQAIAEKDPAKHVPGLIVPSPYVDVSRAGDGAVWVSDPGRHQLELYASDGALKRSWGKTSFAIDGFSGCCNPTHFALLPGGGFVTSEKGIPRVKAYRPDGTFDCVVAGRESFAPDVTGLDLAVGPGGRVLVLDPARRTVRFFTRVRAGR